MLRIPKITYDYGAGSIDVVLSVPQRAWQSETVQEGGQRRVASGAAASWVVRRDDKLRIQPRCYEEEWPALREFLVWAQRTNGSFVVTYDIDEADITGTYRLESPGVGEPITYQRADTYGVVQTELVLRSIAGWRSDGGGGGGEKEPVYASQPPTAKISVTGIQRVGEIVSFHGKGSTGDGLTYKWTFGDGSTASGLVASHIYDAFGSVTVKLVVTDRYGRTATARLSLTILPLAPVAVFVATESRTSVGGWGFDAAGSAAPEGSTYAWQFGDGATGSGKTVSHMYGSSGPRAVSLMVTDPYQQKATYQLTIDVVVVPAPTAVIAYSPDPIVAEEDATFNATGSVGRALTYAWDFGDGATAEGPTALHAFAAAGPAHVQLIATDFWGRTGVADVFPDVDSGGEGWQEIEQSGTASLLYIWDARGGITLNNGKIASWEDYRGPGYGREFTQATATRQPALIEGMVVFDGIDDYMAGGPISLPGQTSYVFIVLRVDGAQKSGRGTILTDGSYAIGVSVEGTSNKMRHARRAPSPMNDVSDYSPAGTLAPPSIVMCMHAYHEQDGSYRRAHTRVARDGSGWGDGQLNYKSGTAPFNAITALALGSASDPLRGSIAQIMLFDQKPSNEQMARLEQDAIAIFGASTQW